MQNSIILPGKHVDLPVDVLRRVDDVAVRINDGSVTCCTRVERFGEVSRRRESVTAPALRLAACIPDRGRARTDHHRIDISELERRRCSSEGEVSMAVGVAALERTRIPLRIRRHRCGVHGERPVEDDQT